MEDMGDKRKRYSKELSTPEGRAACAKRFQVSEDMFAAVKRPCAGHRFLRCRLERVREEWAERCIAHKPSSLSIACWNGKEACEDAGSYSRRRLRDGRGQRPTRLPMRLCADRGS